MHSSLKPSASPRTRRKRLFLSLLMGGALVTAAPLHAGSQVLAWGANNDGQCNVPPGLTNVTALAGGGVHSLALRDNGTVVAWGGGSFGETTVPANLTNVLAIAANYGDSLALKRDGTVVGWGSQAGAVPAGVTNVTAIVAGYDHELALRSDGTVVSWDGTNLPPPGLSNVVAIAAGNGHSLALKADGTVVAWGNNAAGQAGVPAGISNAVAVAAGDAHSLVLLSDGTLRAWGNNADGQTNIPAGLSNVVAIAAGSAHNVALTAAGKVWAWGRNDFGQATTSSNLSHVASVAAGLYHNLALVGDGSPTITIQPFSQAVALGKDTVLRVLAAGDAPLSYQWSHNGTNLSGATGPALHLANIQAADAGEYRVQVYNSHGAALSAPATVTPLAIPPWIVEQPQDGSVVCGDNTAFQVVADGTSPFAYQWFFQELPITDATNAILALNHVTSSGDGLYSVVISNAFGAVTSRLAQLMVLGETPTITSSLTVTGKQGEPFTYTITALHSPTEFGAFGLPAGLAVNATNGVIAGVPLESGLFEVTLRTGNECAQDVQTLMLSLVASAPAITSAVTATGTEGAAFNYQITASGSPTGFGATGLPLNLHVDPVTGNITGVPLYGGEYDVTLLASNLWGAATTNLHLNFGYAQVAGLAIEDVKTNYASPYLLEFEFSLRDGSDPTADHAVVVPPRLLSVTCREDDKVISASETGAQIAPASNRARPGNQPILANLVLDFTASIASLANGDANTNGISDAVDNLTTAANAFVDSLPPDALIGVYEFHRDDADPQQVLALTSDRAALHAAINGIWTNYVQGFPAGSLCWDALSTAIADLAATNAAAQRCVICLSDGQDESSINTADDVIDAATNASVKVFCVAIGSQPNAADLTRIAAQTGGRYYTADVATDIPDELSQVAKDLAGRYIVRWATLKRSNKPFMPSFQISYQGFTADSPTNPISMEVDDTVDPPVTNYTTNFIISYFNPAGYAGDVTVGSLRLVNDPAVAPASVTLQATYIPRYVRQLRLHVQPNWPMTYALQSVAPGEILAGWSVSGTNDGSGGLWLDLASPGPTNYLPFASFGDLVRFDLRDLADPASAFSGFAVDNGVYPTNGPSFQLTNGTSFVETFAPLPHGTPVPWLIAHGITSDFANAELQDPDGDGVPTWSEYWAGTDPQDPGSKFAVQPPSATGLYGHYQIAFASAANRTYRVEASTDLQTWETIEDQIPGTGAEITVTDPRSPWNAPQMYYRVLVW